MFHEKTALHRRGPGSAWLALALRFCPKGRGSWGNLIRAEFYRIRCQRWGFYGLTGSVLGGVVLLTLLCAFPPQNGDAALLFQTIEYSAIVGMVLAVPCADLASARVDGRQVLLKNEAVFGIPGGRCICPGCSPPSCWEWGWWRP